MGIIVGDIEFYTGPHDVGGPDNLEKVIIDFINSAQKSLYIAVQELESEPIAEAIISARKRKVLVKLVIEQSYLKRTPPKADPWAPGGKNEGNRHIQNAILRSNIDIKVDYNSHIFHQKFIIKDSEAVLTGSTNFTPSGVHGNLNHIVIVHDKSIAKIYNKEFREIQDGRFGRDNQSHSPHPPIRTVSDVPIKVLFAPDHSPEMEIMKQMLKARKRIDFAIFTFSKSSGIDDTMLRLLDLGLPIRGAFDHKQGVQSWSPVRSIAKKGAELFGVKKRNKIGKLHHKLMVLDDQVVIAGSFNYTGPANNLNDENIIIIGDLDTNISAQKKAQKKIATFARKEIDRIIEEHGEKI